MIRGRVLVVESDAHVASALARALEAKGFEVDVCGDARAGFAKACSTAPDCVVCAFELPDIDGYWLVRRLRTEAGAVYKTPIVMCGEIADAGSRAQAFAAGADVVLTRPLPEDAFVAQVDALVAMARRFEDDNAPPSTSMTAAIRGDLSMFPLASVLMMFEMERRSGTVAVVSSGGTRAELEIVHGLFASTRIEGDERPSIDVLREILSWRAGRFSFKSRDPAVMPAPRESVGALVLEAMRLEDEKNNGEPVVPTAAKAMSDPFASVPPPKKEPFAPPARKTSTGKRHSLAPKRAPLAPPAKGDKPKPPPLPSKRPLPPKSPS